MSKAREEAPELSPKASTGATRARDQASVADVQLRPSPILLPRSLMQLQRLVGNAAVTALIQRRAEAALPVIQREDDDGDQEVSAPKDLKDYLLDKGKEKVKDKLTTAVTGKQDDDGEEAKKKKEDDPGDALDQVLEDMKSSADKSKQWVEYIYKGTQYYQTYKMRVPISWWPPYLDPALRDFNAMLGVLKPGFDRASKAIDKAQKLKGFYTEGLAWLHAFETFVGKTEVLEGTNPMSVHAWVTAVQGLEKASLPVYKEVLSHLKDLGLEGSPAAAEAFLVLAYVGVELGLGEHLMELGIEDIEYEQKRIRSYEAGVLPIQQPMDAPPVPPLPWMSSEQRRQVEAQLQDEDRRDALVARKLKVFNAALRDGYVRQRPGFVAQIAGQMAAARSEDPSPTNPNLANARYWQQNCLSPNADIDSEIENFETASGWGAGERQVPYPGFDELYETTWAAMVGGSAR
jgi:hypothetical protein